MKFSKIGKHTIRCVISEQEIQDLGYTIEEIMSNGERTQEFMNQIFDMAEQSFDTKFELGIKTVRADFMSDHTSEGYCQWTDEFDPTAEMGTD